MAHSMQQQQHLHYVQLNRSKIVLFCLEMKWKASNEMLMKWLECWRFYDAQHKNAQIAVCAHPKKIARKNPQIRKKTKCNYANQTEKSKTVRRLFVMRKRRKCWNNLWEVFFYRYVCFELVIFSGCVWKSCMLRLGLIRKFTLAHVEFQHCSTCQCFFSLRKALIVFVIAFLHRNNNVYRIDR